MFDKVMKNLLHLSYQTNDPIVEEMRTYGQEFAARYDNDIRRICDALRQSEIASRRKVVRRGPKHLKRETAR